MNYNAKKKWKAKMIVQYVANGLMGIGICSYLVEEANAIDINSFLLMDVIGKLYYVLALLGGVEWLSYLKICKKRIAIITHITLINCIICRLLFLINECCFGGEIPPYMIMFFGVPSLITLLMEINLFFCYKEEVKVRKKLIKINNIIWSIIAVSWSIVFVFGVIERYEGYLPALFYVGAAGMFLNVGWGVES